MPLRFSRFNEVRRISDVEAKDKNKNPHFDAARSRAEANARIHGGQHESLMEATRLVMQLESKFETDELSPEEMEVMNDLIDRLFHANELIRRVNEGVQRRALAQLRAIDAIPPLLRGGDIAGFIWSTDRYALCVGDALVADLVEGGDVTWRGRTHSVEELKRWDRALQKRHERSFIRSHDAADES